MRHLRVTQDGKEWLARLYANVFAEEHQIPCSGPERSRIAGRAGEMEAVAGSPA